MTEAAEPKELDMSWDAVARGATEAYYRARNPQGLYYVGVIMGETTSMLAGPFLTNEEAQEQLRPARERHSVRCPFNGFYYRYTTFICPRWFRQLLAEYQDLGCPVPDMVWIEDDAATVRFRSAFE